MWSYRADLVVDEELTGCEVVASDGEIGVVDESSDTAGAAYLVVDTGFWICGKKRLIPAGAVWRVDDFQKRVWVDLTKAQVEAAPDFAEKHRFDRADQEGYFDSTVG